MELIDRFFETARERYRIKLKRDAGDPSPWTDDPAFQRWRFCNVHREDDRTTVWFRDHVRSKLDGLHVVAATVIFRWFNRVEIGEIIQDLLLNGWDRKEARRRLHDVRPVVTGAYMIRTPTGFDKLDGLLEMIGEALPIIRQIYPSWSGASLEEAHTSLLAVPGLGRFLAYEIITDLRWTPVLSDARDIMTWASAGPGCARGLGRVTHNDPHVYHRGSNVGQVLLCDVMKNILDCSRGAWSNIWPRWEMREVEHWACEFDKYERATAGERLKRRYP